MSLGNKDLICYSISWWAHYFLNMVSNTKKWHRKLFQIILANDFAGICNDCTNVFVIKCGTKTQEICLNYDAVDEIYHIGRLVEKRRNFTVNKQSSYVFFALIYLYTFSVFYCFIVYFSQLNDCLPCHLCCLGMLECWWTLVPRDFVRIRN